MMFSFRNKKFSLLMCFGAVGSFQTNAQAAKKEDKTDPQRPNVLYIMTDDHSYQTISAYGSKYNTTPNIDRIADSGVIFNNSFCSNSLSGPARAVILTGKYSHLNGYVDNEAGHVFDGSQQTMPKIFQANGYQTAVIGKWHLVSLPTGFDYYSVHEGQGTYWNPVFIEPDGKKVYEGYATDLTVDKSIDWLEHRDVSKPFYLMTHFKAPHRNWMPPMNKMDMYEDETFPIPESFYDDYTGRGKAAREQAMSILQDMRIGGDNKIFDGPDPRDLDNELSRMTPEQLAAFHKTYDKINEDFKNSNFEGNELYEWKYQRYMRDYLKVISSVDDNVGRLIDYLQANDLWNNTIVVYASDQGFYMGEHGWFDKRFMYEESIRTPLMMSYPNGIKKGIHNVDAMVQSIDYAPTLLDLAGIAPDPQMQGESMKPILEGKTKELHDAIYYHYYEYPGPHMVKRHYGIRTKRYKLIHFYDDVDEWELYDLKKDPHEMKSVYNDPAYAKVQKMMHEKLLELQVKYQDLDPEHDQYSKKTPNVNRWFSQRKYMDLPYKHGKFEPNEESMNQYKVPDWFRDAKFGIWSHWGPQSVAKFGDWYARRMYQGPRINEKGDTIPAEPAYLHHLEHFGHPSEHGYKDIIPLWTAQKWNPKKLMKLYKKAGAKYFVSMGTHHDNFFLWDTHLNPWNSVDMGPHRDVVGEWQREAKRQGLRFGVSEHLGRTYTWYQTAHSSDQIGPMKGVPYDGNDHRWESLYHHKAAPEDNGKFTTDPVWQREWYDCVKELVDQYQPDLLYSDSGLPFEQVGLNLVTHYYNSHVQPDSTSSVVFTCKFVNRDWYVRDIERGAMNEISRLPWQTDTSTGEWFYMEGQKYLTSSEIIQLLVDVVSKNGNLLLNVVQTPEGDLEPESIQILKDLSKWMKDNGDAIYSSRPWKVFGEGPSLEITEAGTHGGVKDVRTYVDGDFRFTQKGGKLYVFCMSRPNSPMKIKSLGLGSETGSTIARVRMLSSKKKLEWTQDENALTISVPSKLPEYSTTVYEVTFK